MTRNVGQWRAFKLRRPGWEPTIDLDEGIQRLVAMDEAVDEGLLERIRA